MTTLALSTAPAITSDVAALVVGVAEGPEGLTLAAGNDGLVESFASLLATLSALGATGKAEQVTRLATLRDTGPALVVAVGLGRQQTRYDGEVLRRAAGAAVRELAGTAAVATTLAQANGNPGAPELEAVAEGMLLGAYAFERFRTVSAKGRKAPVAEVVLVVPEAAREAGLAAVRRSEITARAVALARDLVNTPPSHLHPEELADLARTEAERVGLVVEVLEGQALVDGGYGGIVGVGQGSQHGPRLVHLSYRGGGDDARTVALIGKGITFDSGGLSLKPAAAMEEMKMDMGGAAAVVATMVAAAELALPVRLEAWVPMAENMPSGEAIRPSDVLSMRSGKKVEVNNTDAEGRLILADAIARACEDSPSVVLDIATLTGAQIIALGARTTAVMGDDAVRAAVIQAADRAGEPSWAMPLPAELRKGLDSEIADLSNIGPREGGMLSAGLFLKEFVTEGVGWAHLDVAGPAYNSGEPYGYTPHGGTGAGVRTFLRYLEDLTAA